MKKNTVLFRLKQSCKLLLVDLHLSFKSIDLQVDIFIKAEGLMKLLCCGNGQVAEGVDQQPSEDG